MADLKLYVWEDVLRDYSAGMAVVLAHDEKEAKEIMKRDFPSHILEELPFTACQEVTEPAGYFVYGGG